MFGNKSNVPELFTQLQAKNVINQIKNKTLGAVQSLWSSNSLNGERGSYRNTNEIVLACTTALFRAVICPGRETEGVMMWKLNSSVQLETAWSKTHTDPFPLNLINLTSFFNVLTDKSDTLRSKMKHSYIILRLCQPWPQRTRITLITASMWPITQKLHRAIIMACAACFPATAAAALC